MIAATLARVLFAIGLVVGPTMARAHPLRFVGAVGTYLTGFVLSLAMLLG